MLKLPDFRQKWLAAYKTAITKRETMRQDGRTHYVAYRAESLLNNAKEWLEKESKSSEEKEASLFKRKPG